MKYAIANAKMNVTTVKECDAYLTELSSLVLKKKREKVTIIVCPSEIFLQHFSTRLPEGVYLGSQNSFWEDKGSFTGETSPEALKNMGVRYVLCGHSERRLYMSETQEMIAQKVQAVVRNDMTAIICIGETQEERDAEETSQVLIEQVTTALSHISQDQLHNIIIAYEPRWAIGTGLVPQTQDILQVRIMIQKILIKQYDLSASQKVPIVYGGSVNALNTKEVSVDADMSGVLIGKESLQASSLMAIADVVGGE